LVQWFDSDPRIGLLLADIVAEVGGNPGNWPPVSCCSGVKPVMPLVLLPAAAAGTP
jgi:hypothetical protein